MPTAISVMSCVTWVCVGFCVGLGWTLGAWLIGKIVR